MGWQERLNDAVKGAGWNASSLQAKLAEFGVKGSSYGSVWAYLNDAESPAPRMEFFEVVAAVLGLRPAWLAFGDGERTEEAERRRRWEEEELARRTALEAGDTNEWEVDAILPRASLLTLEDRVARLALFKTFKTLTGGSGSAKVWRKLERAVLEPLTSLDLPTTECEPFYEYVEAVLHALRQYVSATQSERGSDAEA